jgi:hypothetical protein
VAVFINRRAEQDASNTTRQSNNILRKACFFIYFLTFGGKSNHFISIMENGKGLFKLSMPPLIVAKFCAKGSKTKKAPGFS